MMKFRKLTGVLEILGGLGLFVGVAYTPILIFSSTGLCLLMLMGAILRIKIKDKVLNILPALSLMIINAYILIKAIGP